MEGNNRQKKMFVEPSHSTIFVTFLMKIRSLFFALLCVSLVLALTRCRKEHYLEDASAKLQFSSDTIFFDTVFSTVGSATQYLRVKNNYNQSVRISRIALESDDSQFRINIDGLDGPLQEDIEILPNDSIFIFVEVTIDPGNQDLPFIVEDRIRFELNGNEQFVELQAWGQDAYFHGGLNSCNNPFSYIIPTGQVEVWTNDKPHVIYGIVAVDSAATLRINPGTQVYCHGKSGIYVYKGSVVIDGDLGSEVKFQGDRLESYYDDIPGQWGIQLDCPYETGIGPQIASIVRGGIWIFQSPGSSIEYAELRNGNNGIQVDTTGVSYTGVNYSVEIRNTKIVNMAGVGLLGQGASILGQNLLIGNCGQQCASFSIGGRYRMDNCTFANYWSDNSRQYPTFVLNNYYEDIYQNIQARQLYDSQFNNCIMFGNNAFLTDFNEFVIDLDDTAPSSYSFRYCLVDTDESVEDDGLHFFNMSNNQSPSLCNPEEENFRLSNDGLLMSGSAVSANNLPEDIEGISWGSQVWKGCYAFDSGTPCE
jgi:hypothetical protein